MKNISIVVSIVVLLLIAGINISSGVEDPNRFENEKGVSADTSMSRADTVEFLNSTSERGLANAKGNYYQWVDWNNDGCVDLCVRGMKLFKNNGPPDYDFTDVTSSVGMSGGFTTGIWGDYDNDGDLDLYSCGSKGNPNKLWQNQGAPTWGMVDATVAAGDPSSLDPCTAASWGDYDRDGFLDLYVVGGEDWNDGNPIYYIDRLYHNEGDGTLTDVTVAAGVDTSSHPIYGRGVQWCDFDNDGWQDCYVSNYRIEPNYLWVNNRDGTFSEMAEEYGVAGIGRDPNGNVPGIYYGHTIGSAFGDYNNDGNMDLFQANLVHKDPQRGKFCDDSKFYENDGAPNFHFTDKREEMGIPFYEYQGLGYDPFDSQSYYKDELFSNIVFGDYDNDGFQDFYMPQVYDFPWTNGFLYHNNGNGTFTDTHVEKDIFVHNGYAGAWADTDNDGDLDLITYGKYPAHTAMETRFYENNGTGNHWIQFNVSGQENRFGVGARSSIYYDGKTQHQDVTTGTGSHAAQNSLLVEFGLGDWDEDVELEVWWPSGFVQKETITGVDRRINITEYTQEIFLTDISVKGVENTSKTDDFFEDEEFELEFTVSGSPAIMEIDVDNDGVVEYSGPALSSYKTRLNASGRVTPSVTAWDVLKHKGDRQTIVLSIVNKAPEAMITFDDIAYETEEFILFGNMSSDTPNDLPILEYRWEYPNGTLTEWSSDKKLKDTRDKGSYTYKLYVRDDQLVEDEADITVDVINMAPYGGIYRHYLEEEYREDENILFTAQFHDTYLDEMNLEYRWDFGDGTISSWTKTEYIQYSFEKWGNYTVVVQVKDDDSAIGTDNVTINVTNRIPSVRIDVNRPDADEDVAFEFTADGWDTESDTDDLLYQFDFGDGHVTEWSDLTIRSHKFTYPGSFKVFVFVKDDDGDTSSANVTVEVNNVAPTAEMLSDGYYTRLEGTRIDFEGKGMDTISDAQKLLYQWDFDNGDSTGWQDHPNANYTYTEPGNYIVTFTVKDDNNKTDSKTTEVAISNDDPQITEITYAPRSAKVDHQIQFVTNATDTVNDLSSLRYNWTIDGNYYDGRSVNHTFTAGGIFQVKVKVMDNDGAEDELTATITVTNPPPVPTLSANRTEIFEGESVLFTASATDNPSDQNELIFFWDFGDGRESIGPSSMENSFEKPGMYLVKVFAQDTDRTRGMASVKITVLEQKDPEPPEPKENETDDDDTEDTVFASRGLAFVGIGLAAIAVIALIVLFLVIQSRRKGPIGEPDKNEEYDDGPDNEEGRPETEQEPLVEDTPEMEPKVEEPEGVPKVEDPEGGPVEEDPEGGPVEESPEGGPVEEDPEGKPVKEDPEGKPVKEDSDGKPVKEDSDGKPVVQSPKRKPVEEGPEGKPVEEEPEKERKEPKTAGGSHQETSKGKSKRASKGKTKKGKKNKSKKKK